MIVGPICSDAKLASALSNLGTNILGQDAIQLLQQVVIAAGNITSGGGGGGGASGCKASPGERISLRENRPKFFGAGFSCVF